MNQQFQNIIFIINNNAHDRPDYAYEIIHTLNDILSNNYNIIQQKDDIDYILTILYDMSFDDFNIKDHLINLLSDIHDSLIIQQNNTTTGIHQTLITDYFNPIIRQ
tara:strand:- start:1497 stop:1814 length:318 start_codon:yes stop_codon:yes gene_type:complete